MDQIFKLASFVSLTEACYPVAGPPDRRCHHGTCDPRLVQRIIDQGIGMNDPGVVVRTALLMLGISFLSALFAIGNNVLSVQVARVGSRPARRPLQKDPELLLRQPR